MNYVITFWKSADESKLSQSAIFSIAVMAQIARTPAEALWKATHEFSKHFWEGDVDHVTVRKVEK